LVKAALSRAAFCYLPFIPRAKKRLNYLCFILFGSFEELLHLKFIYLGSHVIPQTKYAKSENISIAYQVVGEGPLDLIFAMGWVSNIECMWEDPSFNHFLSRLASFSRLILFDKRGTGLSDKVSALPTLEQRMDDVRAVMDAVNSNKAALLGISEGGPMCALFAASYPERTEALIMYGSYAKRIWDPEYPWAPKPEERQNFYDEIREGWGGPVNIDKLAPTQMHNEVFRRWWAAYLRRSASPADALALAKMNTEIDIRNILHAIHVPTLIIHRKDDIDIDVNGSKYIASQIPGAKYVELPGKDHLVSVGNYEEILDEIEVFLTGELGHSESETVLATVLFTDIVNSTDHAIQLGDERWRHLLNVHHSLVRKELVRFRGREIDTTGDGFFAIFEGPARAIKCACAIRDSVRGLGINIRAGLHTGECAMMQNTVAGIAVHFGARVMSKAGPGEVLVSGTLKDLVAGSGIQFESRGKSTLKGIPGAWDLYSVIG
jgi:class 3 adenylate cyclase